MRAVSHLHQLGQLQPMPPMRDFIAVGYLVCVVLRERQRRSDFTFGKLVKSGIDPRHKKVVGESIWYIRQLPVPNGIPMCVHFLRFLVQRFWIPSRIFAQVLDGG
jgi:hypothetical protein